MKNLSRFFFAAALLFASLPPSYAAAPLDSLASYAGVTGGTANAQTVTVANLPKLSTGLMLRVKWGVTNTGALGLTVNAFASKSVIAHDGTALNSGDAVIGRTDTLLYNGTAFVDLDWAGQKLSTNLTDNGTSVSAPLINTNYNCSGFTIGSSVSVSGLNNNGAQFLVVTEGTAATTGLSGMYLVSFISSAAAGPIILHMTGSNDDVTVTLSGLSAVVTNATGNPRLICAGLLRVG